MSACGWPPSCGTEFFSHRHGSSTTLFLPALLTFHWVTQLRSPGFAFGDPDDVDSVVEVIVVHTDKGPMTLHGRGIHPPELEYEGRTYRATGGAHEANGGPTKYGTAAGSVDS